MNVLFILLGLILIVAALAAVYWYKNKQSVPRKPLHEIAIDHDVHIPHMFLNKVVSYIDASLALGYSTQDIYDHLKTIGWNEPQINDAFKRYDLLGAYQEMKGRDVPLKEIKETLAKDYKPEQIESTLNHHAAILGKEATPEDRMNHLDALAKEHDVHEADTKTAKLVKFVRRCYDHGYPKEAIARMLTAKGWAVAHIDKAFSSIVKQ
jgi:hypothetical protein